jgi:hypothetical protein
VFNKSDLPPDGRVTRFNALMRVGIKCRWCEREQHADSRGYIVCRQCDHPNIALGIEAPGGK